LPNDSLLWLDKHHRRYNEAHNIPKPAEGWAFPEPAIDPALEPADPIDIEDLPWWTGIPFVKPPGWSWNDWLNQPLAL
jgi:hypothetical protein